MTPRRGQVWVRRPWDSALAEDVDFSNMHVTLACLGPGRYLSVNLRGEIHVWPLNSTGPEWSAWEPVSLSKGKKS